MIKYLAHTNDVVDEGFFNHMMDGGHWSGNGGFAVFWMFIVMLGIAVGVVYLLTHSNENHRAKQNDPLSIAKSRYAKGEINKKQFDEIKKDIK